MKPTKTTMILFIIGILILTSYTPTDKKTGGFGCSSILSSLTTESTPPANNEGLLNIYLTDQMCTPKFKPVCADGITFPNACLAELAGKTDHQDGKCNVPAGKQCHAKVTSHGLERECTTNIPTTIKTSIMRVEVYDGNEWKTVYAGTELQVALNATNTQQIVSDLLNEGNYTKLRITWGGSVSITYKNGETREINFKDRTWEFNIDNIPIVPGTTRNLMIDIPLPDSLEYTATGVLFRPTYKLRHIKEDIINQTRHADLGKMKARTELRNRIAEMKDWLDQER